MGTDGQWYRASTSPAQGGGTTTVIATVPIQGKDSGRDDSSRGDPGHEPPRDPGMPYTPGMQGFGGAFPAPSYAQDHAGRPTVRPYDAPHDDPNWGVPDPSFGTGVPDPDAVLERRAQRAADAVVALTPHPHVHVDHSDEAMAVGKVGLNVGMLFIPEARPVEAAAGIRAGADAAAGAGSGLKALSKEINPLGKLDNCGSCSIALDRTLGGAPASAVDSGAMWVHEVAEAYGKKGFADYPSLRSIELALLRAGPGARGIVLGNRSGGALGHFFNAVNQRGAVVFLDAQVGTVANTEGFASFEFLLTFTP
jgi:hypothetical protein